MEDSAAGVDSHEVLLGVVLAGVAALPEGEELPEVAEVPEVQVQGVEQDSLWYASPRKGLESALKLTTINRNHIGMKASLSLAAKKTCSSPRI